MNTLSRINFLSRLSPAAAAIYIPNYAYSFSTRSEAFAEVEITHGRIKGIRHKGVNIFKGIQFYRS